VPLFLQEPVAPLLTPANAVALRRRRRAAGPECRCPAHGTATPRSWAARHRARACAPPARARAVLPPCLDPASPCMLTPATRPRRRVRVAAMPCGILPSTLRALSPAHSRTHARSSATPDPSRDALDPAEADRWDRPVSGGGGQKTPGREGEKTKGQPRRRRRRKRRPPARGGVKPSRASRPSSPSARAGLLSRRPS
jgi:hypothetical protein